MAYQNSISLGIKLQPTSEIQTELKTAIEQLNKNSSIDLKIDTTQVNKSLKEFSNTLDNINNKLKNGFNFQGVFNNQAIGVEVVTNKLKEEQKAIEQTENAMKTLSSTKMGNSDSNGNITETLKTVEQLQIGIGNTTKLTTDLATGLKTASNTENFQKLENIIDNLQSKLSKSSNNKFINESVITELQNRLNSINTNSADKEFKELQTTINNLGSSDSQIVRLQNTISKMESSLTSMKSKYGSLVGDSSSKSSLDAYISEIEKLKTLMASLQNGGTISGSKLASELNQGTEASRNLSNSVKNSSNALKLATTDSETFGQSIKRALSNTGLYLGTYQAVQMLSNSFRDAITYVVQLDSAMTNLKKVTQETNQTYSSFLNQAHDIAMEYGSQADKVVDATTSWAKTGESLKNATELAKNTMLLTKVGDIDSVAMAQQYMIAPLKAFQIEASKSITLIDKYNNISNNMATSTTDLGEALSKSASSMSTAGNTLDQTLAIISTAESQTKLGGDVVGQALKSVSLRIASFKDENGELIPKFEKQLSALGVTMRDTTTGQILPTFDILQQVGEKFKTMNTNDKLNVSELLGGKLQANVISSVLNNVDELNRAYSLAQNSSNSAMNEFKTYQQGVQYSIDQLKESISNMYKESMNSSSLKSFVDSLTIMVSTFGNLKTVIAVATTAFLLFKGQAITSAIASLGSYISTLFSVVKAEGALTVATAELDIALSTNPFGLIAMAITGVIVVMDALTTSQNNLKQSNAEYVQSLQTSNPNQGQELLNNYKKLESELSTLKQGTQEYKTKEEELATAQQSLISLYPQASSAIDENTGKKKLNADATQKLIDKDKELAQAKAIETLSNNKVGNTDDVAKMVEAYKKAQEEMKRLTEDYNNGVTSQEVISIGANGPHKSSVSTDSQLKDTTKEYEDYKQKILAVQSALSSLDSKNTKFAGSLDEVNNAMGNSSEKTDDNTKVINDNTQAKNDNTNADNGANTQANAITKATKAYSESTQAIAQAQSYLDKLNKSQAVTPALVKQMSKAYGTDVTESLNSASTAQEYLTGKIKEQQTAQQDAYLIMKQDDEQFYQDKIKNNEGYENQINSFLNSFVSDSNGAYNVDLSNYTTLNGLKSGAMGELSIAVDSWMSKYVDVTASGYNVDYNNFTNLISAKSEILKQFAGSMAQFWDDTSQAFTEGAYGGIDLSGGANNEQYEDFTKKASGILATGDKIRSAYKDLDKIYAGGGLNLDKFGGGMGNSDFSGTGSPNKGSSGKSDAEKEAEKAQKLAEEISKLKSEIEPDRYLDFNNAVKQADNELSLNKTLLDSLKEGSPEYQQAELKNIEIYKQKQTALKSLNDEQKKDAEEKKTKLANLGFEFDANGKLINSQQKLLSLQEQVNSMGGNTEADKQAKEDAIKNLKDINDETKKYIELVGDKIPKTTAEWQEQANEISKVNEQIKKANIDILNNAKEELAQDILKDAQEKVDELKKQADESREDAKQSLEDEKTSKLALWDEKIKSKQAELDAMNDETSDNETKLKKLKVELANLQRDNSTEAQGRIQDVNTQITDLQKTIKKDALSKEIDSLNNQKQIQSDNYDQQLSDLEKANKEQEAEDEKHYSELLNEKNAYNKAEKMINKNQQSDMYDLYSKYSEDYKKMGVDLSTSVDASLKKITEAISNLNNVKIRNNNSSDGGNGDGESSSNHYENTTSSGTHYTDIGSGIISDHPLTNDEINTINKGSSGSSSSSKPSTTVTNSNGSTTTTHSDGTKSYSNGDYTDSNGYYHTAGYDTGGRTPSNIDSNGKIGILHASEKILNAKDTVQFDSSMLKIDEIYNSLKESGALLGQLSQSYSNIGNLAMPTLGIDLNKIANSVVNNSNADNSSSSNININNNYQVDATSDFNTKNFSNNLDKQLKQTLRKYGKI